MKVLKLFGGAIVATVVFLIAIWAMLVVVRFFSCGPDSADVKVMKPMAEKISEYIVKNGIPKSLKDIPDLPYRLEGCARESYYDKYDKKTLNYTKIPSKVGADSKVIIQKCYFNNKLKKYTLNIDGSYEFNYGGEFIMDIKNYTSETGIQYFYKLDKKGKSYLEHKGKPYSSKKNGWCTQMNQ